MFLQRRVEYVSLFGVTQKIVHTWYLLGFIPLMVIEQDYKGK